MDNNLDEDMKHLKQPRGPGTGWVIRVTTPKVLLDRVNPMTGKPFGKEIKKGLGTRNLTEARHHSRHIFKS